MMLLWNNFSLYHVYLYPTDGTIILKTPAIPVFEGNKVVLYCQYWTGNHSKTTFFKNGAEILTYNSSSSDRVIAMTIENVTQEDEGFYKCASHDRHLESPESWLSVRPDRGQSRSRIAFDDNIQYSAFWNIKVDQFKFKLLCLLGNFTSTDGTAAAASGKNILYYLYVP